MWLFTISFFCCAYHSKGMHSFFLCALYYGVVGTKRKPSFANELGKNKSKNASILSQNATLIQKEKTPKGCTMCLNTCGLPKHTRRTCPKFTKFGVSAQLTTETLKCFEEKSPVSSTENKL